MTTKTISRTRTGLSGIAAALTILGFITVVDTAVASERIQKEPSKIPAAVKWATAATAFTTATTCLVVRNTKYNLK